MTSKEEYCRCRVCRFLHVLFPQPPRGARQSCEPAGQDGLDLQWVPTVNKVIFGVQWAPTVNPLQNICRSLILHVLFFSLKDQKISALGPKEPYGRVSVRYKVCCRDLYFQCFPSVVEFFLLESCWFPVAPPSCVPGSATALAAIKVIKHDPSRSKNASGRPKMRLGRSKTRSRHLEMSPRCDFDGVGGQHGTKLAPQSYLGAILC